MLEVHSGPVLALAVLPDGRVASGSNDRTVRVWELGGGAASVISRFDLAQIRALLEQYATASAANTWKQTAFKLSRLGKWEFEDYDPKQ